MGLKKAKNYKGIDLQEAHYDIIGIKADLVTDEDGIDTWRIIVKVVMYSDANKIEALDPPLEYHVGNVDNKALITYNKAIELTKQHSEFIGTVEV